jgi:hypothetical protein
MIRHLRRNFVIPTNRAPARAAEESTRSDSVCSAIPGKSLRVDSSASLAAARSVGMTKKSAALESERLLRNRIYRTAVSGTMRRESSRNPLESLSLEFFFDD